MNQIPNIEETHNTREIEEIVEQFEKRMPLITSHGLLLEARLTPTSYLKMKEWLRTTLHQQLQKALTCGKDMGDGSICGCKLDCHLHDWRQREEIQKAREETIHRILAIVSSKQNQFTSTYERGYQDCVKNILESIHHYQSKLDKPN